MGRSKRKDWIIEELKRLYPDAKPALEFSNPFELLVATILSAQTTDIQVNKVTRSLFKVYGTPEAMANCDEEDLMERIRSIGLYRNKAKNLKAMANMLVDEYGGVVPADKKELVKLPGVGTKTANVVVSNAFGIPAIAVDTHVFRVSNRLGLVDEPTVEKTEAALEKVIKKEDWSLMHHCLIYHGRRVCKARNPMCDTCTLKPECLYGRKQ